jgi:hypothetical protein
MAEPGRRFGPAGRVAAIASPIPAGLLAVDRRGDAIIVWAIDNATKRSGLWAVYRRAGRSFGAPQRISENGVGADFGLDGYGQATFVWEQPGSSGQPEKLEARNRAASGRLSRVQVLDTGVRSEAPSIAVNARGDAVACWVSGTFLTGELRCSTRKHGDLFAAPVTITAPVGADAPSVALDGAGRALIGWAATYTGVAAGYPFASVDVTTLGVGATRAGPVQIIPAPRPGALVETGPSVTVDPRGDALLVWGTYTRSQAGSGIIHIAGGKVGGPLRTEATERTDEGAQSANAALDLSGQAVIGWTNLSGPDRITSRPKVTDSFGAPEAIGVGNHDAGTPAVAIDANGNVIALWPDLGPRRPNNRASSASPLLYARTTLR